MTYAPTLIEQLSKDAPFLWFLYDRAKRSPRYKLEDFAHQAEQLEAGLDALGLAWQAGKPVADWLTPDDWGTPFVLATLGIRYQQPDLFAQALDLLNTDEETHCRELVDACLWHPEEDLTSWLLALHQHTSPVARQSAIAVAASQAQPLHDHILQDYCDDPAPLVRCQLLRYLGERQGSDQLGLIRDHYTDADPDIAFAAARSGVLLSDADAQDALTPFALRDNVHLPEALSLIFARASDPAQREFWLDKLRADTALPPHIFVYAVGVAGHPVGLPYLWDALADPLLCRAAGAAFSLVTGADLEDADLDAVTSDDIPQAASVQDWEDDLPVPDPAAVQAWWQDHQADFATDQAWLAGAPVTDVAALQRILQQGNQQQRQLAALYLHLDHQQPYLDCGWPPWRQPQAESTLPDAASSRTSGS